LLERLREFENDTFRFIEIKDVPFTNNQGENVIRMKKAHQKISGCFRSQNGADMFCLLRSYLSSCRKQDVSASEALRLLFKGRLLTSFHLRVLNSYINFTPTTNDFELTH
jgi:transposase